MRYFILTALTWGSFGRAHAEESDWWKNKGQSEEAFMRGSVQTGWAGFLALMTGYTAHNKEVDAEGTPTSAKLIASYVSKNSIGVLDLGYGIQMHSFVNNVRGDRQIADPVFEAAWRFQFEDRWQFGPVYDSFFNQGDRFSANQADVHFAGLQLLREFGIGNRFVGRLGARAMSSMNVDYNDIYMGAIDFQVGWGQVDSWTSLNGH